MTNDLRSLYGVNKIITYTNREDILQLPESMDNETKKTWKKLTYSPITLKLTTKEASDIIKKFQVFVNDQNQKDAKEGLFRILSKVYSHHQLQPKISYLLCNDAPTERLTLNHSFDVIELWSTLKRHGRSIKIIPKPYSYENDQVFIDFANKEFGGGILGRGWVQEESSIAGMSLLPFIDTLRKLSGGDVGDNPVIIKTNTFFTPNPKVTGGAALVKAWQGVKNLGGQDINWAFAKTIPDKDTTIFWTSMVAFALYEDYQQPVERYRRMTKRIHQAFDFSIRYMISKGSNEVVINTGNWGAGAFKWSAKVVHDMQMRVFRFLKMKFALLFPEVNVKLVYFSFSEKEYEKIHAVRETWGFQREFEKDPRKYYIDTKSNTVYSVKPQTPRTSLIDLDKYKGDPRGKTTFDKQSILQDTIFFGQKSKLYEFYESGKWRVLEIDYSRYNVFSNSYRMEKPLEIDLGEITSIFKDLKIKVHHAQSFLLFVEYVGIDFKTATDTENKQKIVSKEQAKNIREFVETHAIELFEKFDSQLHVLNPSGDYYFPMKRTVTNAVEEPPIKIRTLDDKDILPFLIFILQKKFSKGLYEDLLLETSDMYLVNNDMEARLDFFDNKYKWRTRPYERGDPMNILGQVLMEIRKQKRIEKTIRTSRSHKISTTYEFTGVMNIFIQASGFFEANSIDNFKTAKIRNYSFIIQPISFTRHPEIILENNTINFVAAVFGVKEFKLSLLILTRRLDFIVNDKPLKEIINFLQSGINRLGEKTFEFEQEVDKNWKNNTVMSSTNYSRLNNLYIVYLVIKILRLLGKDEKKHVDVLLSFYDPSEIEYYNFIGDASMDLLNVK